MCNSLLLLLDTFKWIFHSLTPGCEVAKAMVSIRQGRCSAKTDVFPDLNHIPGHYHDLREVFNKVKATLLTPHREGHAIDLLPGALIPKG